MFDLLSPLTHLLAAVLAVSHHLTGAAGLSGGPAWVASIALLVVALRMALLPLAIRAFRHSVAMARATPELKALQDRYAGKRDRESLQELAEQRKTLLAGHGVSGFGFGPMLLQLPLLWSMYHLVTTLAAGRPLGMIDAGIVASASGASLLGVHLSTKLIGGASLLGAWPVLGLALIAAAGSFAAARWGTAIRPEGLMAWLPAASAVGVVVTACFVPAGVVLYWAMTNVWNAGQQITLRKLLMR